MKRFLWIGIPFLFAILLFSMTQQTLHARSDGFTGRAHQNGCISCHQGGTAPDVALVGDRSVAPNSTTTYQLLITSTTPMTQTHAGFDLTILDAIDEQAGTLQTTDPDAQISNEFSNGGVAGELTHSQPKENITGAATVEFQWTAPITTGTYTVYFVGNSINNNGSPSGDAWMMGSAEIQVQTPTAIQMREEEVSAETSPLLLAGLLALFTLTLLKPKRQP